MSSENLATAHMISFRGKNTQISNVCIQGKMHIIFFTCLEYVPQIINALIITSRFFISSMPRQWPCNVCFFLVITPINFIFKLLSLVTSRNDVSCLAILSHVLSFHIARFYANPRGCHTNIYLYRISTRDQPIFHSSLHLSLDFPVRNECWTTPNLCMKMNFLERIIAIVTQGCQFQRNRCLQLSSPFLLRKCCAVSTEFI